METGGGYVDITIYYVILTFDLYRVCINLLEARIVGLMNEIERLEKIKEAYHAEKNLIKLTILKAPIRLYNSTEIVSQLRYNN